MTRKLQGPTPEDGKSRKRVCPQDRLTYMTFLEKELWCFSDIYNELSGSLEPQILKPVVEKMRRDRINQSLAELRSLLLRSTSDPRLQNPKIEKAEILDLAVEYLKRWTERTDVNNDARTPAALGTLGATESRGGPLLSSESAGFQQCMAQLNSYMHRIPPTQRTSLAEGLKHHSESWEPKLHSSHSVTKEPDAASVEAACTSESRAEAPWLLFPSHPSFGPLSCSTPCHDYLSPPPSPGSPPPSPHLLLLLLSVLCMSLHLPLQPVTSVL